MSTSTNPAPERCPFCKADKRAVDSFICGSFKDDGTRFSLTGQPLNRPGFVRTQSCYERERDALRSRNAALAGVLRPLLALYDGFIERGDINYAEAYYAFYKSRHEIWENARKALATEDGKEEGHE